jgi:hypothetical protein
MKQQQSYPLVAFVLAGAILGIFFLSHTGSNTNMNINRSSASYIVDRSTVQQVFSTTYEKRIWGEAGNGSGDGSSLKFTTRTRALVEMLIYKYDIGVLVDAPCGQMAWMPTVLERVLPSRPRFRYLGLDIVPGVIQNNTKRFADIPEMEFRVYDFSSGPVTDIPHASSGSSSALFSRDALQHLSYDLIIEALKSFSKTKVDYLFIGSYHGFGQLKNITTGDYFPFDMSKIRNLPAPLEVIAEETPDLKHIVVFRRKDVENFDFEGNM